MSLLAGILKGLIATRQVVLVVLSTSHVAIDTCSQLGFQIPQCLRGSNIVHALPTVSFPEQSTEQIAPVDA